ncbi:MAG: alkaline phosphatase [Cellulosilyticaceae bacterium]
MKSIGKLLKAGLLSMVVAASNISVMAIEAAPVVPENVKAKYIFFFIGDGMGAAQKQLAELYLQDQEESKNVKLTMSEFDEVGLATTWCEDYLVTDSAAAGTALSTGHKTDMGMIGVTPDGKPVETLVEKAESLELATGLVTTTRITHATPASFAAHVASREDNNEIALDYMDSGVEYFAGGGARHFVGPNYKGSDVTGKPIVTKRTDQKDLVKEMRQQGYSTFIGEEGAKTFATYTPKAKDKVFATFASSHMPYTVELDTLYAGRGVPTLAQMVRKGIDVLDDYEKGFLMMVEGGRIDQAAHAHDGTSTIQETLAFDDAI